MRLLTTLIASGIWLLPTAAIAQPLNVPSNVSATVNNGVLTVTWNGVPSETQRYVVTFHSGDASTNSSSTRVGTLSTGLQTSVSLPIPPGVQGTFNVVVAGIQGIAASTPVVFTIGAPGSCTATPLTPTGLTGVRVARTVNIRFNPSAGATSYILLAGTIANTANLFNGNIGNVTSAASDAVDPNIPLFIRVAANNACGTSAPTNDLVLQPNGTILCVPDDRTMCLFDGRFTVTLNQQLNGATTPSFVTRRFNDGGGFNFTSATGGDDLFLQLQDRCAVEGRLVLNFANRSAFGAETGFDLFVGDRLASIARNYVHSAGAPFTAFQDGQSFPCR